MRQLRFGKVIQHVQGRPRNLHRWNLTQSSKFQIPDSVFILFCQAATKHIYIFLPGQCIFPSGHSGACTLLVVSRVLPGAARAVAVPPSPSQQVHPHLSQNGVGHVVRVPSSAPRPLRPLSLGASRGAGRAPLGARDPCPQSSGRLLQNHGAAHCL